ncbi:MAG: S-layer homology domain-containing protein [Clostridia bacterium]|nr:S-layer homology domain-containing protein [Clostridia bacterium]
MKRMLVLGILFAALWILPARAAASSLLSPGLDVIAGGQEMIVAGLVTGDIRFREADFVNAVGCSFDSVTVTSLPPASDGHLLLGDAPVAAGQQISARALSSLRFVPTTGCRESSFRFRAAGDYSIPCLLRYTDESNAAPLAAKSSGNTADAIACWTQQDIAVWETLEGSDPDGDALHFEIADYPQKGLVELTDASGGSYRYTPFDGVRGTDSFTYTVRDAWGHYSAPRTVTVTIAKAASNMKLSDMEGHWAHNAALVMASEGAMDIRTEGGALLFDPDVPVTREDFLVTVMKALGAGDLEPAETDFADDAAISPSASGYVARAVSLGIVKGQEADGKRWFRPQETVTRAEAAVILNAIIGAEESDAVAVFADSASVPAWARSSLSALTSAGIFRGTGAGSISANRGLTRAEVAEILLNVRKNLR